MPNYIRIACVAGAWALGTFVFTPLLTVPILNLFGFSAIGPVAGTFAAGAQSGIGNVVAGSWFATAQGIAMGAGIPAFIQVVGGAVAGVFGGLAGLFF